jgi:hypothetical protein
MRALVLVMLASAAHADPWSASCPIATHDGLCVRFGRAEPAACDATRARWIAVPRDPARVQAALAHMTEAEAELARADLELEAMVADTLPKLHFGRRGPAKRSAARFDHWLYKQSTRRQRLAVHYSEHRALARVAQLSQVLASQLMTSAPPHDFRSGPLAKEKRAAYCDQMTEQVQALDARALEDFAACAGQEPANAWNAVCVRALETIDPATFPPMREKLPKLSVTGGVDIALEGKPEQ